MAKKAIRPIRIEGNIAYVPLTKGYEAVIDAADVPLVGRFNWWAKVSTRKDGSIYAVYACRTFGPFGGQKREYMHRALVDGYPDTVDHADGNGLNNRRQNLRPATVSQNMQNARLRANNTSGVKGVSWDKSCQKWFAYLNTDGKRRNLGLHGTLQSAEFAVTRARRELHGEFGRTR